MTYAKYEGLGELDAAEKVRLAGKWSELTVPVGTRARFFHPRTLGVMLPGKVVKWHEDGTVSVRFDVDRKVWRTCPEHLRA